jgi:hypothetical protein
MVVFLIHQAEEANLSDCNMHVSGAIVDIKVISNKADQ